MANADHVARLQQGVKVWNAWRQRQHEVTPSFAGATLNNVSLAGVNLEGANLYEAVLSGADLQGADLRRASLVYTDLRGADLRGADLSAADLGGAQLCKADLRGANLCGVNLSGADLREANLNSANLMNATLVETIFDHADLTNCKIYGIAAWNVHLNTTKQSNLIITDDNEPTIMLDNLKVAQFIYLLLSNPEIREVIDTITSKVVLILGRFTPERKVILDTLRNELRCKNYTPVLFDFEGPASRDITETVTTLAHMARFVIADITDAKSIPQELMAIVPNLPSVPVQPLLLATQREYGMFEHFKRYPWVLPMYEYNNVDELLICLGEKVIEPAEAKSEEQRRRNS